MNFSEMYRQKLVSPAEAAKLVNSGDWVDMGFAANFPTEFDKALAARADELSEVNLRGAILMQMPEVFKIPDPAPHFIWHSWHSSGIERKFCQQGFGYYGPVRYSELPRYYTENIPAADVFVFQSPPMDKNGFFNFGISSSQLAAAFTRAKKIVVEVNTNQPWCDGLNGTEISIKDVDYVIESSNPQMPQMGAAAPSDVDNKVAELIVNEIPNGACLQLGIGGMPNAVGALIAKSDLKDLGVHTEMYVDAFVDLAMAGKINGLKKGIDKGRQVYTFAAGTQKLYDYIDHNPECQSAPVDYVNDVRVIAQLDNFISINNALEVDLFGQISAEAAGFKHISGAGGQLDFVLGAYLSKGGKSIICLSSEAKGKDGSSSSRIVPSFAPGTALTGTRATTQYVCTEYGIVNLKGMFTWQRAEALIGIAHPDFRDQLIKDAEKAGIWGRTNKRV
ncbi:MAG: butyryl-CoA:acetate CoA-transferase [Oscillospiraceae bacterium]|nr:butyryl-CoA:acetate CoA-transferase [Oscillospiraceae bacterium]